MIYDYYKKIEARTSKLGIVAEKAIEFREFDFDNTIMILKIKNQKYISII